MRSARSQSVTLAWQSVLITTLTGVLFCVCGCLLYPVGASVFLLIPFACGFVVSIIANSIKVLVAGLCLTLLISSIILALARWDGLILCMIGAPFDLVPCLLGLGIGYLLRKHIVNQSKHPNILIISSLALLIILFVASYWPSYQSMIVTSSCMNRALEAIKTRDIVNLKKRIDELLKESSQWPLPPADSPLDFYPDKNAQRFWQNMNKLKEACVEQRQFGQAIALIERSSSLHYIYMNYQLGDLYSASGSYLQAESSYKEQLDFCNKYKSANDLEERVACWYEPTFKLAVVYTKEGKFKDAEVLLKEGIKNLKKAIASKSKGLAMGQQNDAAPVFMKMKEKRFLYELAMVYLKEKEFDHAQALFEDLLNTNTKSSCGMNTRDAYRLDDLADCYTAQGKHKQAKERIKQALSIWNTRFGNVLYENNRKKYSACEMARLADVDVLLGEYGEAERLYAEALELYDQSNLKKSPILDNSNYLCEHPYRSVTLADRDRAQKSLAILRRQQDKPGSVNSD